MKSPHLLYASGNVLKLKKNLVTVLDAAGIQDIQKEIFNNVRQLYALGRSHFLFANRLNSRDWRHKVSRLYYAAYNTSRAVRLCVHGEFSEESSDHKKIEALPDDFPNKNTYSNRLSTLRDDRNVCDYDHTATSKDLVLGLDDSLALVTSFLSDARKYLQKRGATI